MRLWKPAILAAFACVVSGDVLFTSPAAGATLPAGSLHMEFKDSGVAPALSLLTTYTIDLMAGGEDKASWIAITTLLPGGAFSAGLVQTGTVMPTMGGLLTNAYFLRITSVASQGGTVINYSNRFSLTGMTGTFPAAVIAGVNALTTNKGPATENNVANNAGGAPAAPGTVLPYSLQTGLTRYAPMQGIPPTKITAKTATPLYPTSAFTVATTFLPRPEAQTTITQPQTFSVQSVENTAAAASQPVGYAAAVKRAVERWQDE